MIKILVADKISQSGVDYLRAQSDVEVLEAYDSPPEKLAVLAGDVQGIIVRSASSVTADIMAAAPELKAVGRAGVGVDNIDIEAATDRGIIVMNTPSGNTIATAELAFTHLLCTARPVAQANASMKSGEWDKKAFSKGTELYQKTLGVLGLGRIGSEVAKRARAFKMRVLAYDPFLTPARAEQLGVEKVELDELFSQVDFITIHMPKTEATTKMINAAAFAKMKDGVRIVNCARGGLIDEADLAEALKSGKVSASGLDVFETEPLALDSPLRRYGQIVLTPHLGASTLEAQENVGLEVAEIMVEALRGGRVRNALNAPSIDPALLKTLRPYLVLADKMGTLIQQITPDAVTKLRLIYSGKLADMDVTPLNRAIQRGYLRQITNDVNDINAPRVLARLGVEGEIVKTDLERDYTELIRIEACDSSGRCDVIEGTLIGKSQTPRLTFVNGRDLECSLTENYLLVIENKDVPGIVGRLGMTMAKEKINISHMSLGRNTVGGIALNICGLDSRPSKELLDDLRADPHIERVDLVDLAG